LSVRGGRGRRVHGGLRSGRSPVGIDGRGRRARGRVSDARPIRGGHARRTTVVIDAAAGANHARHHCRREDAAFRVAGRRPPPRARTLSGCERNRSPGARSSPGQPKRRPSSGKLRLSPPVVVAVAESKAATVAIATEAAQSPYFVVSPGSAPVHSRAALRGKTLGLLSLGGGSDETVTAALKLAGVDLASVKKVASGSTAAAFAF